MNKWRRHRVASKRLHAGATAPGQYLTGIDILHGHVCVPLIFVYKNGFDTDLAQRGLVETLRHYPQVAGRLKTDAQGHVFLDGNDAGLDYTVYRCDGPMPYGEHRPLGKEIKRFYKAFMPWQVVNRDQPVLTIDIHCYDDGGIVMCVSMVHSVFDGFSFYGFLVNWSAACRGVGMKLPSFDREAMIKAGQGNIDTRGFKLVHQPPVLQGLRIMARLGWRALTGIHKEIFRIPAQAVQKWKDEAKATLPHHASVNTGKLVTAYVLKALSPVMPKGVPRSAGMALDMRYIRRLPLPRDYFGNGLCYANVQYTEQELAQESLSVLAEKCRPALDQVSAEHVTKLLAVAEQYRQKKAIWRLIFQPAIDTLAGGIVQNNLSLLPIYDVDLGNGTPTWYETFAMTIRMMALVSTPSKDGGIDLHVNASKAELKALRDQLRADAIVGPM
jgi:shikimate O-hydroxycinnamoyltransferase